MNKGNRGARIVKKKPQLHEVKEYEGYNDDDDLLTNEEIQMMNANNKANQNKSKNRVRIKSDSLIDQYQYSKKGASVGNSSHSLQHKSGLSKSKQAYMNQSIQNNYSIDEDDEEDNDVLQKFDSFDVKEILEDAIKKKDNNNSTTQKKNQDFLCQVLAQMILKNKINKENAFEIPLPDVMNMSDFSKVSEASWQKLSSSLDSGSKIYGYRVDSLHQESFKMLSGLIRSQYMNQNQEQEGGRQEDDNEDLINKERERLFKKNKKISESTIEKNIASITLSKYDIQFEVDPLFCKTSEKFDDSSSKGILLNNISIDSNIKLLIDSENFVNKFPSSSSVRNSTSEQLNQATPEKKVDNKRKKKKKQKGQNNEMIDEKLSWHNIQIRSDINELELCSGLEHFVNNMLSFDDSSKKFNYTILEDEDGEQDNDSHKKLITDIVMNSHEEELINDIQTILTQTAKKGKTAMKQSQRSLHSEAHYSMSQNDQDNFYRSVHMTPYQDYPMSSQRTEFSNEILKQSRYNTNTKMEVLNEGVQSDDNLFPYDYSHQESNQIPESNPNHFQLFSDDNISKESSNGFSTSITNTLGDLEQTEDRLFSLQNMAFRMTQIGSGQFFNQIEKDKTQWMNPQDWQLQKQKKEIVMIVETPSGQSEKKIKTKRKTNLKDSDFRFDFFDEEELKAEDFLNKKKKQKLTNQNQEMIHLQLLSIDHHYKPQWLFKTSYFDLKEIEEQERLAKIRQEQQEEEEQYKGFNGDDDYDIINQIDEYTLLGATPMKINSQMEIMDGKASVNQNNYDDHGEPFYYQDNFGTQINSQQDQFTQSNPDSKNQPKKKHNVRKMKIQELKSRLWTNLEGSLGRQKDISYVELLQMLELQKSEQASLQSCLVAILHLCNENNLQLYDNDLDNFMIRKNVQKIEDSQASES